jgi:hypothetical protein
LGSQEEVQRVSSGGDELSELALLLDIGGFFEFLTVAINLCLQGGYLSLRRLSFFRCNLLIFMLTGAGYMSYLELIKYMLYV